MTFTLPTGDKIRYRGSRRYALIALAADGKGAIIYRSSNRGFVDGVIRKHRSTWPFSLLFVGDRTSGKVVAA
jgi:hypothetical protein